MMPTSDETQKFPFSPCIVLRCMRFMPSRVWLMGSWLAGVPSLNSSTSNDPNVSSLSFSYDSHIAMNTKL